MQINWLQLTEGPEGIPIPTYGQYGGPNWSGGVFVGDDEPGDYTVQPEDPLDALFLIHDRAYDQPDTLLRAQADLLLIQGILQQSPNEVMGEGDLYAGGAIIAMLYQIAVVNDHPEILAQVDVEAILQGAVDRIEEGSITPEPQEIAGFVTWLGTVGQALAESDSPIAMALAGSVLDLAASLTPVSQADFQEMLSDEAIEFVQDVAPRLADAIETIVDPSPQIIVEELLDNVSDWFGDVAFHPAPVPSIEAVSSIFATFERSDFLI